MGVCVLVIGVSLLLSVVGTLVPLAYFSNRPVQIESLSASILWMLSLLGKTSLKYVGSFGSLNVLSPLSSDVTSRMTALLVVGLPYTWWLQWRRRRMQARIRCHPRVPAPNDRDAEDMALGETGRCRALAASCGHAAVVLAIRHKD